MIKAGISQRLVGYLMAVVAAILLGLNGNFSRLLFDDGVSPLTLLELRMLIGGLGLLIVLLIWDRRALKLYARDWGWVIGFGLSLALVSYTYFVAISRLPLAIALVIQFSASAWMALGEAIWCKKLPALPVSFAVCLSFGGVILLTGIWQQSLNGLDGLGLLFANLSLLAYIVYMLAGKRIGRNLPAITSTTYGAFVACFFCFLVQPPWSIPAATWQPQHLWPILFIGTLGMAIPFSLTLAALRRLNASRAGIAGTLELVTASIIGYFWLGQHLNPWQIAGCTLVFISVIILQYEQQN
jgi:drug/metabolite transporter (DMT)-like permease